MNRLKRILSILLIFAVVLSACGFSLPASPTAPVEGAATPTQPSPAEPTPTQAPTADSLPEPTATSPAGPALQPFPIRTFELPTMPEPVSLREWVPNGAYGGVDYALPLDLNQVSNQAVLAGLTPEQQQMLGQNGFVVMHSNEAQFNDIREQVAYREGQPYYLTTDSAYHALHITFDEMLKALEAQYLRRQMMAIVQAALDEVLTGQDEVQGTQLEADMQLAADTLAVALKLFDPQAVLEAAQETRIAAQLAQIAAGGGTDDSALIPYFKDDYGAYRPVGHYAGIPELEAYFQGMTWLGRVHFLLKSDEPGFVPSRAPLVITLALRTASLEEASAAEAYAEVHSLLTFLIGHTDDPGPAEYAALMDQVYGTGATFARLADEALWAQFLQASDQLPAPQINSTFVDSLADLESKTGWRFMGQRFTLDGYIFQNLVFDKVGTREQPRWLPSGLDVMAAFGSPTALDLLERRGDTAYTNYTSQMEVLQQAVRSQPDEQWRATFYTSWLAAFFPQVQPKDGSFPTSMLTEAWAARDLNSVLGSWAELKHDTVLYAKMPEAAGGGGPPMSGPPPSYVEASPNTFYRLAYAAQAIGAYMDLKLNWEGIPVDEPLPGDFLRNGLYDYVQGMLDLGGHFLALGDLAVKELNGEPLNGEDYERIQSCMGPVECLVFRAHTPYGLGEDPELPEVPVVAAVAGANEDILQVGVGLVDRIYVVVPLEGSLQVAQGGVLSYYEFKQPRADRLTDEAWRERLAAGETQRPEWTALFSAEGGETTPVLAFRVGDVYIITEEGDRLNVRSEPTTSAGVVQQLSAEEYVEIVDGPVQANGYTWWKLKIGETEIGWAVENQEWYRRSTILEDQELVR